MKKKTVQRHIFISNTIMVIVTLIVFLVINVLIVKVYSETVEQEVKNSLEQMIDNDTLENIITEYTIRRNSFVILFVADGVLCVLGLVIVSQLFTKNLVSHIMVPINALIGGTKRIRNNDLSTDIEYTGEVEFEEVCNTFNDMQKAILKEQERNCRYEKARTDMIAGISHDLRTPLTAIRGTIKGLIDGVAVTQDMQNRFLKTAYRRTEDMNVLLSQLFYLSKLETGNMPINIQTIAIRDFITNYINIKNEIAQDKDFDITADLQEIESSVRIDPEQLLRVFDNLLENSKKYACVSSLHVRISLKDMGDKIQIRFKDNGKGVEPDKLPYIFEEFYRCDESRNIKDGNGLGLYIVKYLVQAMGGSVTAENLDGFAVDIIFYKADSC